MGMGERKDWRSVGVELREVRKNDWRCGGWGCWCSCSVGCSKMKTFFLSFRLKKGRRLN